MPECAKTHSNVGSKKFLQEGVGWGWGEVAPHSKPLDPPL